MYGFKAGAAPKDKPKGGKIKGPGTGTSDSIKTEVPKGSYIMPADSTAKIGEKALDGMGNPVPVNLSNGEYQMPPEQVHAVGAQVLDQMKDATHTPVAAQGFRPQDGELYFADGGAVQESTDDLIARISAKYGTGSAPAPRPQPVAAKPQQPVQRPAAPSIGSAADALRNRKRQIDEAAGFADGGLVDDEQRRRLPSSPFNVSYGDVTGSPSSAQPKPQQPAGSPVPSVSYGDLQRAPNRPQPAAAPMAQSPAPAPATPPAASAATRTPAVQQPSQPEPAPMGFSDLQREPNIPRAGESRQMPQGQPLGFGDLPQGTAPPAPSAPPQGAQFGDLQREPNIPRTGTPRQMPQGDPASLTNIGQNLSARAPSPAAVEPAPAAPSVEPQASRAPVDPNAPRSGTGGELAAQDAQRRAQDFMAGRISQEEYAASLKAPDLSYQNNTISAKRIPTPGISFLPEPEAERQLRARGVGAGSPTASSAPTTAAPSQQQAPEQQAPQQSAPAGYDFTPDPNQGPALGMRVRDTSVQGVRRIDNAPGLNSPLFTNLPTGQAVSQMQGGAVNTIPAMRAQQSSAEPAAPALGFGGAARQGPSGGVIGDGMAAQRERDALIRAASTPYRGAQNGQLTANQLRTLAGLQEGTQRAATEAANQQAATERAAMQEQGANARAQSRDQIDSRRVASEERVRDYEARGLDRVEKVYAAYENAKTPEERAAAAELIRVMNGKEAPNRYTVVPGGQEFDPAAGTAVTRPARVFNNQTGQFVDQPGMPQQAPQQAGQAGMQKDAIYIDDKGNRARWDGSKFVPVN